MVSKMYRYLLVCIIEINIRTKEEGGYNHSGPWKPTFNSHTPLQSDTYMFRQVPTWLLIDAMVCGSTVMADVLN